MIDRVRRAWHALRRYSTAQDNRASVWAPSGGSAPVLNTHRSSDARDVVGRVVAARLEGGRGYAT